MGSTLVKNLKIGSPKNDKFLTVIKCELEANLNAYFHQFFSHDSLLSYGTVIRQNMGDKIFKL